MKSATDFSKAKVGDKIWTIQGGDVLIQRIDKRPGEVYTITTSSEDVYNNEGYFLGSDKFPSAFWSNPHIVIPSPPKRKVKKVLCGWVNVNGLGEPGVRFGSIYKTKEDLMYCEVCKGYECIEIN
jgi:hypothetical protein